jgi:DNA-binding transcriptional ArsR family regulator
VQASSPLPRVVDPRKVKAVRGGLPAPEVVADAIEVFKALANPIRLRLVHALVHYELCVGDLARAFDLSMSAVSHQLALLRRLKLVASREDGRQTYYRITDEFVGHLVHDCLAHVGKKSAGRAHHHRHRLAKGR